MRPVGRERVTTFGNKVCRSGALGAVRARRYPVPHDGSVCCDPVLHSVAAGVSTELLCVSAHRLTSFKDSFRDPSEQFSRLRNTEPKFISDTHFIMCRAEPV